jgi:WhiB family redox-sensing transcriptional regulator
MSGTGREQVENDAREQVNEKSRPPGQEQVPEQVGTGHRVCGNSWGCVGTNTPTVPDHWGATDPTEIGTVRQDVLDWLNSLRPPWHAQAACRGEPTVVFFPDNSDSRTDGARIRAACPVRAECLDEALADPTLDYGIRAGMAATARRAHRRATRARGES